MASENRALNPDAPTPSFPTPQKESGQPSRPEGSQIEIGGLKLER